MQMMSDQSSLLFYPFEKGQLEFPESNSKTLFWNTQYVVEAGKFNNFDCLQAFKPDAVVWEHNDIIARTAFVCDVTYQNIFCVLPKQKDAAIYMLARSLSNLDDNGLLVAVAANDAGGNNIEKWMKELGALPSSLSKSKCRIVWAYKNNVNQQKIDFYINNGDQKKVRIDEQSFITKPGVFGWNKIDKGSKLLLNNLPEKLTGIGADFGCGYGYLSIQLLNKFSNIDKLYMLEADYNALACAKENTKKYKDNIEYSWVDLTTRQNNIPNIDWIVMNPPFHTGKQTSNDVGQNFITQAANCLKKNGVLYMVANSHLPYEKLLEKLFSNVVKTCEKQGYKIFIAKK